MLIKTKIRGTKRFRLFDQDTGDTVTLELLGKGMFADVYYDAAHPDRVFAIIPDDKGDYSKEILASIQEDGNQNPFLPQVKRGGDTADARVFVMPRYFVPLRAEHKKAWAQYRKLKTCIDQAPVSRSIHDGHKRADAVVSCVEASGDAELIEALELLRDYMATYGSSYTFEFAPRNLGVDASGHLILLDVVFDLEAAQKLRKPAPPAYDRAAADAFYRQHLPGLYK